MPTISATLKIKGWLLMENFDCDDEFSEPVSELKLFGKVIDSDDEIIDEYSFQLMLASSLSDFSKVTISDSHIFIGLKWPQPEISNLVSQLETDFTVKFAVLLSANKYFSRDAHENVEFSIKSIIKAYGT